MISARSIFNDKNANRKIGAAGVMRVKGELLARGWEVAEPDVDCGVDLLAWDSRRIARIQVKSSVRFYEKTHSSCFACSRLRPEAGKRSSYSPGDVDFVVCVCLPTGGFWIVPACDVSGKVKIHLTKTSNYHQAWELMSGSPKKIFGDAFKSQRALIFKLRELEKDLRTVRGYAGELESKLNSERACAGRLKDFLRGYGFSWGEVMDIAYGQKV